MAFSIVADFPLGTYRGRRRDGTPDGLPSPARLHAALLNAAAQGPWAEETDGRLGPSARDREVLEWLEAHPPDGMLVPPLERWARRPTAYRRQGWFSQKWADKALSKDLAPGVAVGGSIGWVWSGGPPPDLRTSIEALCHEVPYLGTTESPVVLRVAAADPTHRFDKAASLFVGTGLDVEIPTPGRTAALEDAHAATLTVHGRKDTRRQQESEAPPPVVMEGLGIGRYVPIEPTMGDALPWSTAIVLPLDRSAAPDERLRWCVALHRSLVSLIGDGAPSLVTGHYGPGVRRPANRLAIQYLDPSWPADPAAGAGPAMLLLIPFDADAADIAVLGAVVGRLRRLRIDRRREFAIAGDRAVSIAGDRFWGPVPAGSERVWVTEPAALPDTRPPRRRAWSLADAAYLSLGLVWRDRLTGPGRGAAWYERLAAAVREHGAEVLDVRRLPTQRAARYVHRINDGTVVQPYRATLRLGRLGGVRTVVAIGQSRHLGGGLLVPVDLAVSTDDEPAVHP
ncbi:MAG: type I-U CRISPR-associated protein Csb2 [Chloroflexota bacterium]